MTLAISKAVEDGAKAVVCASTGNTSASAAAYATRAGLTCAVLIPEGHIALGKLAQALIHGARVLQIRGNFDEALRRSCASWASTRPSPSSTRSTRTASRARRRPPSRSSTPSATPPTCTASRSATPATSPPTGRATASTRTRAGRPGCRAMLGFQAAGAAPIVDGHAVEQPRDDRHRHPHRQPGLLVRRHRRRRRSRAAAIHRRHRRRDPRGLPVPRRHRVGVLRAGVGRVGRRPAQGRRRPEGAHRRLRRSPATASRTPTAPSPDRRPHRRSTPTSPPSGPSWGCRRLTD